MTSGPTQPLRVKICGIRSIDVALAAAQAGADLLGFNFAPISKRRIDVAVAREAILTLRSAESPLPPRGREGAPRTAGIFVNQPITEVARIAREVQLDYVQLSGDEDAAYCRTIHLETGLPVIAAVRLTQDGEAARISALRQAAELLLTDAAGSWGGSGQTWRWQEAAGLAAEFPVLLAGGLNPDNVADAAAAVRPWGVDVASGVETDGTTDPDKVRAFIASAKSTTKGNTNGHHR